MASIQAAYLVGIISDTHGLLRPEAMAALQGSDLIVHAGDIGNQSVLDSLDHIAPVFAVRGNNDHGDWAENIPASRHVTAGGVTLYVLHDLKELDEAPTAARHQRQASPQSSSLPPRGRRKRDVTAN